MKPITVYSVSALSACFCLMMISLKASLLIASIICINIAPHKSLATLPLAFMLLGGAVAIIPAGFVFKHLKRKIGLLLGVLLGLIGAIICVFGVKGQLFWVITLGLFFIGLYSGVAQFYRFSAADISPPDFKAKAVSYVLFGAVFSAILAPLIADSTRNLIPIHPFLATYLTILSMST
jgi:MFS family permease